MKNLKNCKFLTLVLSLAIVFSSFPITAMISSAVEANDGENGKPLAEATPTQAYFVWNNNGSIGKGLIDDLFPAVVGEDGEVYIHDEGELIVEEVQGVIENVLELTINPDK